MLTQDESELLSAYLDNELAGDELNKVNDKIAHSVEWQDGLRRLRTSKSLITALPRMTMPSDLLADLERQAEKAGVGTATEPFWKRWAAMWAQPRWMVAGSFASIALALVTVVGVKKMNKPVGIPLESLLAAHSRAQMSSPFYQDVMAAGNYSAQLKKTNEPKV